MAHPQGPPPQIAVCYAPPPAPYNAQAYGQPPAGYAQPPPAYGQHPPAHGQPPAYGQQYPPQPYAQPAQQANGGGGAMEAGELTLTLEFAQGLKDKDLFGRQVGV